MEGTFLPNRQTEPGGSLIPSEGDPVQTQMRMPGIRHIATTVKDFDPAVADLERPLPDIELSRDCIRSSGDAAHRTTSLPQSATRLVEPSFPHFQRPDDDSCLPAVFGS